MTLDLRYWAHRDPLRAALRYRGALTTYGELEAAANALARAYARAGLRRGDHVAVLLGNGPMVFVAAWAAWRSGVYLTPVSTALSAVDAAHVVRDCAAVLVLADADFASLAAAVRDAVGAGPRWWCKGGPVAGYEAAEPLLAAESGEPRPDETPGGLMLYTSGTTGAPRGVWRPLPAPDRVGPPPFAADIAAIFGFGQGDRYLSTAPLYHAAPLRFALTVTAAGGTVVAMDRFDAADALSSLVEYRITHSQWVPTMFQRLLRLPEQMRRDFAAPDHRRAFHAAAPCPQAVKRAMIDWWGPLLVEYYSGSEGVGLTMLDSREWLAHPGSVGRAVKGIPHVLDESGGELGPGRVGRIYFSGVPPFRYFNDDEKTAARTDARGWQTFGDVGYLDEDGYLHLTDRVDDTIISGGVNVYPQEIEAAILELDDVADCGVVGFEDPEFGERPVAFVVAAPGRDGAAVIEAVKAFCEHRLGRIKRPSAYVLAVELPRSASGKLLRRHLRRHWGAELPGTLR